MKFLFKVLDRITYYRTQKGWTEYQLAEESGLTQSTISSWYRKDMVPSISSLEKICSQFFSTEETSFSLTQLQKDLLEASGHLTEPQQQALIEFFKLL